MERIGEKKKKEEKENLTSDWQETPQMRGHHVVTSPSRRVDDERLCPASCGVGGVEGVDGGLGGRGGKRRRRGRGDYSIGKQRVRLQTESSY